MKDLLHALGLGTNTAAVLIAAASFLILYLLGLENWLGVSFSVIAGLAAGVIIGTGNGVLYFSELHAYKGDFGGKSDGLGNCYYKRYWYGYDFYLRPRPFYFSGYHAELSLCQRL